MTRITAMDLQTNSLVATVHRNTAMACRRSCLQLDRRHRFAAPTTQHSVSDSAMDSEEDVAADSAKVGVWCRLVCTAASLPTTLGIHSVAVGTAEHVQEADFFGGVGATFGRLFLVMPTNHCLRLQGPSEERS